MVSPAFEEQLDIFEAGIGHPFVYQVRPVDNCDVAKGNVRVNIGNKERGNFCSRFKQCLDSFHFRICDDPLLSVPPGVADFS